MDGWSGFVLAGLALAGSPGPATLSLAAAGAAFGPRAGLVYLAGIVAGLVVVMVLLASGVIGLVLTVPGATPVLTILAGAYMLYLAYRIATAPPLRDGDGIGRGGRLTFRHGLLLSLVNPKGYAAMAAVFSGFVLVAGNLVVDAALKIAVMLAIVIGVNLIWLNVGAGLSRQFRDPRQNRIINMSFAGLLVVSVILAVLL